MNLKVFSLTPSTLKRRNATERACDGHACVNQCLEEYVSLLLITLFPNKDKLKQRLERETLGVTVAKRIKKSVSAKMMRADLVLGAVK